MAGRRWLVAALSLVVGVVIIVPPGLPAPSGGSDFPLAQMWRSMWAALPAFGSYAPARLPAQGRGGPAGRTAVGSEATRAHSGTGRPLPRTAGALPAWEMPQTDRPEWTAPRKGFDPATSVPDPDAATATSQWFTNTDGSRTLQASPGPINFKGSDGRWKPIDLKLVRGKDGRLRVSANSLGVSLASAGRSKRPATVDPDGQSALESQARLADAELASLTLPTGEVISYSLQGASLSDPAVSGSTATYADALPGTDIQLETLSTGLKETLVLKSRSAAGSWVFPLRLTGLTPQLEADGSISLRDALGSVAATIPHGYMEDSNRNPVSGDGVRSEGVTYELATVDGQLVLRVTADRAWLDDPARVFPVRVDPTAVGVNFTSFVQTGWTSNNSSATVLRSGTWDAGADNAMSFLKFNGLTVQPTARVTSAQLNIHAVWSGACSSHRPMAVSVSDPNASWDQNTITWANKPSLGTKLLDSSLQYPDNTICGNTSASTSVGTWWGLPLTNANGLAVLTRWLQGGTNNGLAVTTSTPAGGNTTFDSWLKFSGGPATGYAPVLYVDIAPNSAPQVTGQYPVNGFNATSLTPELIARSNDPDFGPSATTFKFTIMDTAQTFVDGTGTYQASRSWRPAVGKLKWGQTYLWTVVANDGLADSISQTWNVLSTAVPQPPITSGLSQNPGRGYEPSIGNYTANATDADIPSVGPKPAIQRSYNSRDPRTGLAFGTGWSSLLDAKLVDTGTTAIVTYPSGQDVAFGRTADGKFESASGRYANLTDLGSGTGFELADKDGTRFRFTTSLSGGRFGLTTITDASGRVLTLAYTSGQVTSITSASGRALTVAWSGGHVSTVTTPGGDAWTYTYSGNSLTSVCPPTTPTKCTVYGYQTGSLYPTAVLDAAPHTYLRLNEPAGATVAQSSARDSLDTAAGAYTGVTLGQTGPLPGSTSTAAGFDGVTSRVELTSKAALDASYQSVSMWFKTTVKGGVLLSYQKDPITNGSTPGNYTPSLYIGATDGRLRGEFWYSGGVAPALGPVVTDGNWHHVVLVAAGSTQTMYVDGTAAGSPLSGMIAPLDPESAAHPYVGTGYIGGSWPDAPTSGGPGAPSYFTGSIAEIAIYTKPLSQAQIDVARATSLTSFPQLNQVTRPSGGVSASVTYDAVSGVVSTVTDANNGVWQVGNPSVAQSSSAYQAAVLAAAPADYFRLKDYGTSTVTNEVNGNPASYSGVKLGSQNGPFADTDVASFDGTSSYVQLPPQEVPTTGPNSVSMWFRMPFGSTSGGVLYSYQKPPLSNPDAAGQSIPALYVGTDGNLRGGLWMGDGGYVMKSPGTVNDGRWHHVTLTAVTSGSTGTEKLYLDGTMVATSPQAAIATDATSAYLGVGKWQMWPVNGNAVPATKMSYWPGQIAEFAFFTRELTAAEISAQVAARTPAEMALSMLRGTGAGTVQPDVVGLGRQCADATSIFSPGDFDSDGKNDVICRSPDGKLWLNQGNGQGGFTYTVEIGQGWNGLEPIFSTGDWNGDGKPDVLYRRSSDAKLFYIAGNGLGGWITGASIEIGQGWASTPFSGGDWDGDGKPDVLYRNLSGDGILWMIRGNGTGGWINGTSVQVTTGLSDVDSLFSPGDFSGDGKPDLVYRRPNGNLYLLRGNGTGGVTGTETQIASGFGNKEEVFSAKDFDGDGKADILFRQVGGALTRSVTVTDPMGGKSTYGYDLAAGGRLVWQTDARGTTVRYGYDTSGFMRTTTDANGNLTQDEHDARGNVLTHTTCQDRSANQCSTVYYGYFAPKDQPHPAFDLRNDLVTSVRDGRSSGEGDPLYATTYAYDSAGNMTSKTDPLGRVTSTLYTDGVSQSGGLPGGAVPPKGLPWAMVKPTGVTTYIQYFGNGDIARTFDEAGLQTDYTYDSTGRVSTQKVTSDTYPAGLTTTLTYDKVGRILTETDPAVVNRVTGATHTRRLTSVYDDDGNPLTVTAADLTGGDSSRTVTNHYNAKGQLDWTDDPMGKRVSATYDLLGRKTSETDKNGVTTAFVYDAGGNQIQTVLKAFTGDPNNPSPAADQLLETRAYDPAGRLAAVTDAMGWVTAYTYTDNNLLVSTTRSNGLSGGQAQSFVLETDSYDKAGNLTRRVTNNGATITDITVDRASRPTRQVVDPAGVNRAIDYTYRDDDLLISTKMSSGAGTGPASYMDTAYDWAGRAIGQTRRGDDSGVPVGWWKLNGTNALAYDSSYNQRTTQAYAGVTWTGDAGVFTGSAGQQIVSNGPALDTTQSFTVSAWVNLANTTTWRGIVSQDASSNYGYVLNFDGGTKKWAFGKTSTDTANSGGAWVQSDALAATSTWTHLTGVYDRGANTLKLYVNGVAQSTVVTAPTPFAANGPLEIGNYRYNGASSQPFQGSISNVQVYQQAVTGAAVTSLYGKGRTGGSLGTMVTSSVRLDQRGLAVSAIDPLGNTTDLSYDEAGRLVVSTAPAVSTEENGGAPVITRPTSYVGYDTFGGQTETKDPKGRVTVSKLDANGRGYEVDLPSYTPPGGSPVTPVGKTFYDDNGQIIKTTDPLLHDTLTVYDQLGRVAKVTTADGGVAKATYDLAGNVLSTVDPTGAVTASTYDYLGRKLTDSQVVRQPSTQTSTTSYIYETRGFLQQVTPPSPLNPVTYTHSNVGEALTSTRTVGANSYVTSTAYDYLGRPVTTTAPDLTSQTVTYDFAGNPVLKESRNASGGLVVSSSAAFDPLGQVTSATDPNGHATTFAYDALGQLTQQVEPLSASDSITTTFGYDAAGSPTRYTDGRGSVFLTTYNSLGLPESTIEPATSAYPNAVDRTFTTVYNVGGQVAEQRSPGGVTTAYTYDVMGRMLSTSGAGAEVATTGRSYTYDLAGRPVTVTGAGGTNTLTYDDRGLLLSASGPSGNSSFAYNIFGAMTSRTDAAGTTSYAYDALGRNTQVLNSANSVQVDYTYTSMSQVDTITYGSTGNRRTFLYDALHRPTTDELKTSGGTSIAKIVYGWDSNGNETSKTTTGFTGSAANTYTYDWANRLTSWNNGTTNTAYAYDKAGNRTQAGGKTFTYDQRNHLLTSPSASMTYQYTARGTLKRTTTGTVDVDTQADAFNQVLKQYNAAGTQSSDYTYDGLGRALRAGNSFSGAGNDLAADSTSTYTRDPYGGVVNTVQGAVKVYTWTDLHSDVVGQLTSTGTTLSGSVAYDPLGGIVSKTGMLGNLGYQSEYTDALTGRVNMAARWYNTDTGQFDTRDTASNSPSPASGNANRFAYGNANPLTMTDPDGHRAEMAGPGGDVRIGPSDDLKNVDFTKQQGQWKPPPPPPTPKPACREGRGVQAGCEGDYTQQKCPASSTRGGVHTFYVGLNCTKAVTYDDGSTVINDAVVVPEGVNAREVAKNVDAYGAGYEGYADGKNRAAVTATVIGQAVYDEAKLEAKEAQAAAERLDKAECERSVICANAELIGTIVNVVAAVVTTGVCLAATGGAGSIGCAALGGFVGGFLGSLATSVAANGWSALLEGSTWLNAGIGGATGALEGAIGAVTGGIGGRIAGRLLAKAGAGLFTKIAGGAIAGAVAGGATGGIMGSVHYGIGCLMGNECKTSGFVSAATAGAATGAGTGAAFGGVAGGFSRAPAKACPHSFDPETPVLMADSSTKAIKDIQVGDKVTATDPTTGQTAAQSVTALHNNQDWDLTDLEVRPEASARLKSPSAAKSDGGHNTQALGDSADVTTIHTTWHHPFWDTNSASWVEARALVPGRSTLTGPEGQTLAVISVSSHTSSREMRDITVEQTHTYYVVAGTTPVLVHNCDLHDLARAESAKSGTNNTAGAIARDTYTGEWAYGESGMIPKKVHPQLKARLDALKEQFGGSLEAWPAGECAEFNACNNLLWEQPEVGLDDIEYATIFRKTGENFPSCDNCRFLLGGGGARERAD